MNKKTYVLNKPALLTSEESLLRFDGGDIVIPMAVLEDLQSSLPKLKSARQAIARKVLDKLDKYDFKKLSSEGIVLENGTLLKVSINYTDIEIEVEGISQKDKRILQTCLGLTQDGKKVVLISNNPVMRMKARQLDIVAEELKDRVFPSSEDQYKGYAEVFALTSDVNNLFTNEYLEIEKIYDYQDIDWQTNLYLSIKTETGTSALAYYDGKVIVPIKSVPKPCGLTPKNIRQKFFLHALMDPNTPLVIGSGTAGTGKTICTLAAGKHQTIKNDLYDQILITKSTKKVEQEELGYLPGDLSEKFDPYMSSIYDNLEVIYGLENAKHSKEIYTPNDKFKSLREELDECLFATEIIKIQTIGHIRGRSLMRKFFIIDEAQNISPESIKQIVTRAGEGSKFVFLGDPSQVDSPELTEKYNGLVYLSEMMKGKSLCRQVKFDGIADTVRSPLAQLAVDTLI